MSETDVRTFGLLLVGWIAVGAGILFLGWWVETSYSFALGQGIRVIGSLVLFSAIIPLDRFSSALSQRTRNIFHACLGVTFIVAAGWLYRYVPESRNLLLFMIGIFVMAVAAIVVGGLVQTWYDKNNSRVEEEL